MIIRIWEVNKLICTYPKLETRRLEDVKSLEKKIGKTLLAFSCREIHPSKLKEGELEKIKEVEKKLGVSLVAIEDR